ncbi:MAG: hypothetical protein LBU65_02940, partial [Planctomycetaceae bacterium]|nr:hypothetical protein [Planctomycetaceae bacterium]
MSCLTAESYDVFCDDYSVTNIHEQITLVVSPNPPRGGEWSGISIDCSRCDAGGFTESLLEILETGRTFGRPRSNSNFGGRVPFVSKAMAWLRLSDHLIIDDADAPILITGFGNAHDLTQREIFRLIRFYLAYKPCRGIVVHLTDDDLQCFPEELQSVITNAAN